MKRVLAVVLGSLASVLFVHLLLNVPGWLSIPTAPLFAGEEDMATRLGWLVLSVPVFVALGGWLGAESFQDPRSGARAGLGAVLGGVCFLVVVWLMAPFVERLEDRDSANRAVALELLALAVLMVAGALGGRWVARRPHGGIE